MNTTKTNRRRFRPANRRTRAHRQQTRSRRLALETLEPRQMLSHSGVEFQPPGLPADGDDHLELPPGLPVVQQTHWINGKPFEFVTTVLKPPSLLDGPLGEAVASSSSTFHPLDSIPVLHSNPSALAKLYLDFDGHFEAQWGGYTNVTTPVYDRDGDLTTFSDAEIDFMIMAWQKTSEDFAPFNIDVTTEQPPELAPGVPESVANGVALRVAIGGNSRDWTSGDYGGLAYIDNFTNSIANVVYVFPAGTGDGRWDGDVTSHEAGHGFGLAHQSTYDANGVKTNEYNPGDGNWAPIMGNTYIPVTTWYNGTSSAGPNVYQDDMEVIARTANGFGFRADDHGDTITTADALTFDGQSYNGAGLIGTNTDVDVWSFTASAQDTFQISVAPAAVGPNLDAVLNLWDSAGSLIATASPLATQAAELLMPLAPGTYFAGVTKTAAYGWLGAYTIAVTSPSAGIKIDAPEPIIVPERGAANLPVTLLTQPTANVTIPFALSDAGQATLATTSLTFTPANWDVPQILTLTGIDDGQIDNDVPFSVIVGAATSTDAEYGGLDPSDIAAVSTDHGYGGFAYWSDRNSDLIQRSSLGGGAVETLVDLQALYGLNNGQLQPRGMAIDLAGGKMYWADITAGRIQRADLDGSNVEIVLTGLSVMGIELDVAAGKIYWTNWDAQKIQRSNLDGTGVEDLVTQQAEIWDVALDTAAGKMYWSTLGDDSIRRANLNGSSIEILWTGTALSRPGGLALDLPAGRIYWYDSGIKQILRSNLDGSAVQSVADLSSIPLIRVAWLNVDSRAGKLYWVDWGNGAIYRANLDGSNAIKVVSGLLQPQQMAIVEPGVTVVPDAGLLTSESGAATTFSVALTTPPAADVTIPITSGDATEGSVSASSLTFTPANWNVPQTVTVTGANDTIFDGDVAYTVVLGAATSSDPDYAGVNPRDVSLTNLDNEVKFYVVNDATVNTNYKYAADGTARGSSALTTANAAPRGVASTILGDKTWVIDANRNVYVYRTSDGALLGSWTAGSLAGNATPEGIATDGTDVWIVDGRSDKVFRYEGAASRLSGSQPAISSFGLSSGNTSPKDIVTDGSSFWVVNDTSKTDKVFKYSLSGGLQGSWTIDSANKAPTGITIDPSNVSHIWIVDSGTDRVYQYTGAATRTNGSQSATMLFALAAGNTNPQGIADPPGFGTGFVVGSSTDAASSEAMVSEVTEAEQRFASRSTPIARDFGEGGYVATLTKARVLKEHAAPHLPQRLQTIVDNLVKSAKAKPHHQRAAAFDVALGELNAELLSPWLSVN